MPFSVGIHGDVATLYNVGKIKKDDLPSANLKLVESGSKTDGKSSNNNISDSNVFVKRDNDIDLSDVEIIDDSNANIRNSMTVDGDFSYDTLVSKPNMPYTYIYIIDEEVIC